MDEPRDRIEEAKQRLYSRSIDAIRVRKDRVLKSIEHAVPDSWQITPEKKMKAQKLLLDTSVFKKFFLFCLAILGLAIVVAGFTFLKGTSTVSTENVEIEILGNAFTEGGAELPIQIQVLNKNATPLELADLFVEYPRGSDGMANQDFERKRISIGTISAGKSAQEIIPLTLYGEEGTVQTIRARLEYRIKGSNAIFVKEKTYDVSISSAPLELAVTAPTSASSGEEVSFKVVLKSNSAKISPRMRLVFEFPPGFESTTATPEASSGDTVFDLGDLPPDAEKTIIVRGVLRGIDGDEKMFRVYSGEGDPKDDSKIDVVYNSILHTMVINRPFLEAQLVIGNKDSDVYAARTGSPINAQVKWQNNLPEKVIDAEISVTIDGNVYKEDTLKTDGFYNAVTNTINWNKNIDMDFASVEQGENGTLDLSFNTLPLVTGQGTVISDPHVTITVSIRGKLASGGSIAEINNSSTKTIKIISDTQFTSVASFSNGPFTNSGPLPPSVDDKTTFTITWNITNTANPLGNGVVRGVLPLYVSWENTSSPTGEQIVFDEATREITWNTGTIPQGSGFSAPVKSVSFKIGLTPTQSELGEVPEILSEAVFTARDLYTGVDVSLKRNALSTRIFGDATSFIGKDAVVE